MRNTVVVLALMFAPGLVVAAGCGDTEARKKSMERYNIGAQAYGQKQYETAIGEFTEATKAWPDNHKAWYAMGQSYGGKNDWKSAGDSFAQAVKIKDDDAMYHLMLGHSLLESSIRAAREEQAKREGKKPEEINPDLHGVNFEPAQQQLAQAAKLNNELWRAHFDLGRIYREQDKAQEAAQEFTTAIQFNPREKDPYVALGDLYLRWDYYDQAIQVTSQGAANVPGQVERSEVYFVLGMGYYAKKDLDKAIEAFTHSLDDAKDNHKAKFQRGQAYFEKGDFAKAKKDLEQYAKSSGRGEGLNKGNANKMLLDIAAKQN
jgi:tetratricopeptide (TPR) repeat protein